MGSWSPRTMAAVALLVLFALVPPVATALSQPFYITLFSRIMIYGLAAFGLNLILGFGGLVSFGHALYIGIGAYAVGILSFHGIDNGFVQLAAGMACGTVVALALGAVCLRTSGMAFIMITLAFAQMFYFLAVSLRAYGGDDGLPIRTRSDFGLFSLTENSVLYYTILVVLAVALYCGSRLVHSRFGLLLRGSKANDRRLATLGFPTLRYKLAAYVLSALVCVVAGMLLANLTKYTSPSYMQWQVSGDLIVMIVLGGLGTVAGPVVGAAALLILEEILSSLKLGLPWGIDRFIGDHWMLLIGIFIIIIVLNMKQGLLGFLPQRRK